MMNIEKYTWLANGDTAFLEDLVDRSVRDFQNFKDGYVTSILATDITKLKMVIHEIKSMVERLEIEYLLELMTAGKELLRETEKNQEKIEENANKVSRIVDEVIEQLQGLNIA